MLTLTYSHPSPGERAVGTETRASDRAGGSGVAACTHEQHVGKGAARREVVVEGSGRTGTVGL